jgi:hypothetical protein
MRRSHMKAAMPLALALCAGSASAVEFDFSGFGSAGFTITDTDKAEFVRGGQSTGATSDGDVGVDSIAGVQATVRFNDRFSGSTQVLLRRLYNEGFELDVPLAFVKAEVSEEVAVRVGRLPLPAFLVSDFRQVGYANTWVRPPNEVYGQVPMDNVDGLDVLYSGDVGSVNLNGQAFFGRSDVELSNGTTDVKVRDFWGVNLSATFGPLTLRAGRTQSDLSLSIASANSLIAGLRAAGFAAFANELAVNGKESVFTGYGALLDWNNLIVQIEETESEVGGFPADTSARYGLVGYRVGKFTPFAMYAEREVDSARTSTVVPQVGPLLPLALGVNALIAGTEQSTASVGVRWDAADSVAVKFQYEHVDPKGGAGLFKNAQAGFGDKVNVLGFAVDVVF